MEFPWWQSTTAAGLTPPVKITAGDAVSFQFDAGQPYSTTSGYSMAWLLIGAGIKLSLTATGAGTLYTVSATPAQTAALTVPAGGIACRLFGYAVGTADRNTAYSANCFLAPNPTTITGDTRGQAQIAYDAIKALLAGKASRDQQMYKIGDRELQRIPVPELLMLLDHYRREAGREIDAEALMQGRQGRPRTIFTRMQRG